MKIFEVLKNKNNDTVILHNSFSWLAFMFGPLWLIYHRLWKETIAIFAVNLIFFFIHEKFTLNHSLIASFQILFAIVIAYSAKSWYRDKLLRSGFKLVNIIAANSHDEVILKFHQLENGETENAI